MIKNTPALHLNLSQNMVMTPQLRQAIALLQMNAIELQDFVANEMLENPYLSENEEEYEVAEESQTDTHDTFDSLTSGDYTDTEENQDFNWDNVYDSDEPTTNQQKASFEDHSAFIESASDDQETLQSVLKQQLSTLKLDPITNFLGLYLIDLVDESGYIRTPTKEIAQKLKIPTEKIHDTLAILQTFEPTGVCAPTLEKCLRLQLHAQDNLTDTAIIVLKNLDLVAKQDFKKLAKLSNSSERQIIETIEDISNCNPKPGLQYGHSNSDNIIPDIIITETEDSFKVELNSAAMPKVLINQHVNEIFTATNKETQKYLNDRMGRAKWLINSLETRAKNMFNISQVIVKEQEDFFRYGIESLKPLTLKQVADLVEVHESTVSRITTNKFMQTPQGTFELKYFFSAGIGTTGGNVEVAAESVKAMIKRLIGQEDPRKPLSDEKLVSLLKDEGIDIARRTVAKYREALGIMSSSGRRIK